MPDLAELQLYPMSDRLVTFHEKKTKTKQLTQTDIIFIYLI